MTRRRGGGALSDTMIRPSVCPSLGYEPAIGTLAACSWPATRDVRTADPSTDGGRRSVVSRTAIGEGAYRLAAPGTITRISLFRPKHGSRSMNIQQQQTSKQKRENLTTRAQEFNKFSVKCFCTFCHRSLGISNTKHCWQHLTFCRCQHPQYAM